MRAYFRVGFICKDSFRFGGANSRSRVALKQVGGGRVNQGYSAKDAKEFLPHKVFQMQPNNSATYSYL